MKVLTRYLLRAHIGPFLFAFVALTGVILINTLARSLADLAGKGLSGEIIFRFFLLSLPANIALTFPMSVLVAVLFTFSQMAAENEITALKASGVDLRRLSMPLLLVAALIAGGMVVFNDRVLPESNHRWRQLMADVGRATPLLALREQTVNTIKNPNGTTRYYLQAGRIFSGSNRMQDVVIYDLGDPRQSRTIYADSGRMAFNASRTDLYLTLYDGQMREVNFDEPQTLQRLDFQRQMIRMDVGAAFEQSDAVQYRGDREMTIGMMRDRIDTLRTEIRRARVAPPSAGFGEQRVEMLQRDIRSLQVEIQKKYAIAAATLVFVMLGAPLALRFPRGGIGMVIAVSLTIFSVYYVGLIGGEKLADAGYVPPMGAMWITNTLLGTAGLLALVRMGRERSTQRGGGEGLLVRLRNLRLRREAR